MIMTEAKTTRPSKLGGKSPRAMMGQMSHHKKRLKRKRKRSEITSHGYIRGKKVNGRRYYYGCQAVKQPDGTFKEVCEYFGTYAAIRAAVRDAKAGKVAFTPIARSGGME